VFADAVAVATAVLVEEAERVCVAVESISVDTDVRKVLSLDAISVRPVLRSRSFVCESCNLMSGRCSSCMSLETIDAVSMPEARPETWNIDEIDEPGDELTVPTMVCP
jgi:hypothetical protein